IDVTPTLLAACDVKPPSDKIIDGVNLLQLLKGEKVDWPDRMLFFQWHRGDLPELNRACAVRSQRYRLVHPPGVSEAEQDAPTPPHWEVLPFYIDNNPLP